ncbi:MAG: hypothetical protein SFU25_11665 [Candidatus Caenarcaniphilales bacterium]|nr:hypothetical protein [Candidatus Caenarcaniphilales bacterium]
MGFSSQNNLSLVAVGVFLFLTFIFLVNVRGQVKSPKSAIASEDKEILKGRKDGAGKQNNVELLEPGLFKVVIPEALNYPPDKILQEVTDPTTMQTTTAPYYRYQSSEGQGTYEIGYIRLPEQNFQAKTVPTILDDLTRGEVSRLQGTLKKETTNNQTSYLSTREIEIESVTDNLFAREYLVVNRPYAFILCLTSNNKKALHSKKAAQFFDSFELFQGSVPKTIIVSSPQKVE